MSAELLHSFTAWLTAHPGLAYLSVFLIALGESLAVVGLFVPGSVMMFGVGALIALDALSLWPSLLWAALGALAGDGASFWLGRHYHQQLKVIWPFRRYPGLINAGVDFFHKHGGKSVLLGRFVGPVRPIIPAIAGMLDMPPWRFLAVNALSALGWAPAYILPGVVFGASLGLAAEVAGRLAVLLGVLLVLFWLTFWLGRRIYRVLAPRTGALIDGLWRWALRHPHLGEPLAALVDPRHPETRALTQLALLLGAAAAFFLWVLGEVAESPGPSAIDSAVYHFFQGLRTPPMDGMMVALAELGDAAVYLPVVLTMLAWLLWRRRLSAAAHWIATVAFGLLLTVGLKLLLQVPRPIELYHGLAAYAFPSGHATMSLVGYGFIAVLAARELPPERRPWPYLAASLVVVPIAVSRLYLGAHWLSDVIGGLTLGLVWVTVTGLAYRRHPAPPLSVTGLLTATLVPLLVAGALHIEHNHAPDLLRYMHRAELRTSSAGAWREGGWRALPAWRIDLGGDREQPINLQWAGSLSTLRRTLEAAGWHAPLPLTAGNALRWLAPQPKLAQLPVLPQVNDGRYEVLLLTRPAEDADHQYVLRLWRTPLRLLPGKVPVWIGTASRQHLANILDLISFPRTDHRFAAALARAAADLAPLGVQQRRRHGSELLLIGRAGITAAAPASAPQ